MLPSILRRCLGFLGLATLASCATPNAEAAQSRPAMWQVYDEDTTIYLFGTIHLLPTGYPWRTATFDNAVAASQGLVVETIVDEKNPQEMVAVLGRLGFSPGQPPIADRVPAEKRPALEAAMAKSGFPRETFDRMETWAAAFILLSQQFQNIGLSGTAGVESVLREQFATAGKPIDQLETNAEQLGFFDTLPEKAQRAFLEGAIEQPTEMREQFNDMLAAWARGDVESIAKTFNDDLGSSPEMMEAIIRRRNANWSDWVERRLATPGTVMLAVGAGHLAGDNSMIEMLKNEGYQVRRVQ